MQKYNDKRRYTVSAKIQYLFSIFSFFMETSSKQKITVLFVSSRDPKNFRRFYHYIASVRTSTSTSNFALLQSQMANWNQMLLEWSFDGHCKSMRPHVAKRFFFSFVCGSFILFWNQSLLFSCRLRSDSTEV